MTDDEPEVDIARSPLRPYREVVQARLLLDAAAGVANAELARRYEIFVVSVTRLRFLLGTNVFITVSLGIVVGN